MENENRPQQSDEALDYKISDLRNIFGKGYTKLLDHINHDNPALDDNEILEYAWSLIPEATAYTWPAHPEDILENAIMIHEEYEAFRRVNE